VDAEEYANARVTAEMPFETYAELVKFLFETRERQTAEQRKLFALIQFERTR